MKNPKFPVTEKTCATCKHKEQARRGFGVLFTGSHICDYCWGRNEWEPKKEAADGKAKEKM